MNQAALKTRRERLAVANRALKFFAADTELVLNYAGYVYVRWQSHGKAVVRRWMSRGQSFYPVWYRQWGHGGSASTALSQLVRWVQGKPVLPLSSWRYWGSERCNLFGGGKQTAELVALLSGAGYPEIPICVLCGEQVEGSLDWWSLDGVSGPCHSHRSDCRQHP